MLFYYLRMNLFKIRVSLTYYKTIRNKTGEEKFLFSLKKEFISHIIESFTNHEIAEKQFLLVHIVFIYRHNIDVKLYIP